MNDTIRFACTGCGKCCTGHHVPLTLGEARPWAASGGQVVVLIEGFVADGPGMPAEQRDRVLLRSHPVVCGTAEAWAQGPALIHGQLPVDPQLAALIEASRQADRDDIAAKVAICQALGMTTSALKGNGFTAYLPAMEPFAQALAQVPDDNHAPWTLHVEAPALAQTLASHGLQTTAEAPVY
ncbi:YkgJ family cysteine cluster protein [Pseudomonas putida]|nr:YkgJ family cysteine cluster protein [Pseudomonas putida]